MGSIILRKKLLFMDITSILYSVDSHARRGRVASHTQLQQFTEFNLSEVELFVAWKDLFIFGAAN